MKKLAGGCIGILGCLAVFTQVALGETVHLKGGETVTGRVIADKAEFLAVDLGYTILQIPHSQIETVAEETTAPGDGAAQGEEAKQSADALYSTARLPQGTVRELVAGFGQAVVKVQTPQGLGSGLIINPDGYIITNAHVIQGETRISIILFVKRQGGLARHKVDEAQIVAVNPTVDLALLKIDPPEGIELPILYFGEMERVRTGEPVFAIGNPLGLERSVSEGIVSQKSRQVENMLLLQTTAPINPGNSGGPLLNMRGEVIGITNLKIGAFAEGLGFAIPVNYVKDFLRYREAYAYDKDNPNSGYHYLEPPHRPEKGADDSEDTQ